MCRSCASGRDFCVGTLEVFCDVRFFATGLSERAATLTLAHARRNAFLNSLKSALENLREKLIAHCAPKLLKAAQALGTQL
ncbi:hypothetical protein D6817_02725 [Candidatus Pacearchaeota archaeon]|nr:MAG: hypothetical protein D6817_02725 [Candidatus Pacearchaeota archaeon]